MKYLLQYGYILDIQKFFSDKISVLSTLV